MTHLGEHVSIARRFQKAIRIDSDLDKKEALEGYICPKSSGDALETMARHASEAGHGAFTWTGPYGSGKSSLILIFSALLSPDAALRAEAERLVGESVVAEVRRGFPISRKGWRVVGAVGRRASLASVLGEAIVNSGLGIKARDAWSDEQVLSVLSDLADDAKSDGLILFVDEMGKVLEAAAQEGGDLYLFQQVAELASRSGGRLAIVGVLHQAFDEYANRMARDTREEWSKIQGRFVDLIVNTAGEEQIDLLSRAIESDSIPSKFPAKVKSLAGELVLPTTSARTSLERLVVECWPLHPVVAMLLGPISRRRFGQNQRSLFGFLNSAEPFGFQDFLRKGKRSDLYLPYQLWDYLQLNLEPSILASPDGHRWAVAAEAIARCESLGGDDRLLRLLKSIAIIDLFKERSGLVASDEMLRHCLDSNESLETVKKGLEQLAEWSLIIFKRHLGAYAVFAGSDFDIEGALDEALSNQGELDFKRLNELAGIQPILAKRHYHETGALRWFDIEIGPLQNAVERIGHFRPRADSIGLFLLGIPTANEKEDEATKIAETAVRGATGFDAVVGISPRSWTIASLAKELLALEAVRHDRTELVGDPVARREVAARLADAQAKLEAEIQRTFDSTLWHLRYEKPQQFARAALSSLASDLADNRFEQSPRIKNELLNREKPSSSAVAAQNALLRRMVSDEGRARLGIDGYPAEGGLFASLLEATGLYEKKKMDFRFVSPRGSDPANLLPLWAAADKFLADNSERSVSLSELYDLWGREPFGLKPGLRPIISVAYILSKRNEVALYRQRIFQARVSDLDVEYLARDPSDIQLRWMNLSEIGRKLLSGLAAVVRDIDSSNELSNLEPIDVGRGLISIYVSLPQWTQRTMRLSASTIRIRGLLKKANDPNQLIFNDLPQLAGGSESLEKAADFEQIVDGVKNALTELVSAYPQMLARLADNMLAELQVPNSSAQALAELRSRAENVKDLGGDFRLNAFVNRLSRYQGTLEDIEGLAGLATNKPARDWIDADMDNAAIELTELAQQFNKSETVARVKGRADKRHAMAVVLGLDGRPAPHVSEFDVSDSDREKASALVTILQDRLDKEGAMEDRVILAALAELSFRYMSPPPNKSRKGGSKKEAAL